MYKKSNPMSQGKSVYDIITDKIIEKLETGIIPWQRPWNGDDCPKNLINKKEYRGINTFILGSSGYASPYWLSFKQVTDLNGHVRKGEKATPVIFWKRSEYTKTGHDENGDTITEEKTGLILRYYNVFNTEQTDVLDLSKIPALAERNFDSIDECENIVSNMPNVPKIQHKYAKAYYSPGFDFVNMPRKELFKSAPAYYATLFHELSHSTGHATRLGRKGMGKDAGDWSAFGTEPYAQEELVAAMGSAYLCGHVGIEPAVIDNAAAYIKSWLGRLRKDKKVLIFAAAQAQKAADFILGNHSN